MNFTTTPGKDSRVKKSTIIWGVVAFIVLLFLVGGCSTYNGMVTKEEGVTKAWADVQASYQRRLDLIPNLVNTVKGYAAHEKETIVEATAMRTGSMTPEQIQAMGDELVKEKEATGGFNGPDSKGPDMTALENLNSKMGLYINAVHEAYPDLKANVNFLDLQKQLESTENRINTERNNYNASVQDYNISIRKFPNSMFAGLFGFDTKQPFSADAAASKAPEVQF